MLAFLTSAVFRIDKNSYFSILSILFIISGFIFLYLVAWEFAKAANLANKVIGIIVIFPFAIFMPMGYKLFIKEHYNNLKYSTIASYRFLNVVLIFSFILSFILIIMQIIFKIYFSFLAVGERSYNLLSSGFAIFGFVIFLKDIFIKHFFKYDESQNKVKKFLLINNAFYYNSSFGIILIIFSFLSDIFFKIQFIKDWFFYTGVAMLFVLNIILILIKNRLKLD